MKKILLLMLTLLPLSMQAQDEHKYQPLVVEGKSWHYTYNNTMTGVSYAYSEYIEGDTIIEGQEYKCLYDDHSGKVSQLVREEDEQLFYYDQNRAEPGDELVLDFNLNVGGIMKKGTQTYEVVAKDKIKVGDLALTRLFFKNQRHSVYGYPYDDVWVEGVGCLCGLLNRFALENTGRMVNFDYCEFPDGTRFNASDFLASLPEEHKYQPLVVEGKSWMVDIPRGVGGYTNYYMYIQGDTIIDDQPMKNYYMGVYQEGKEDYPYKGSLYETDGKVYLHNVNGETKLYYDFTLHVGDKATIGTTDIEVVDEFEIEAQGQKHRTLRIAYVRGGYRYEELWVEGIGTRYGLLNLIYGKAGGSESPEFRYCQLEENVLFTGDDFAPYQEGLVDPTQITEQPSSLSPTATIYNIQGHKVTKSQGDTLPKGVYIQNGRKFVVK